MAKSDAQKSRKAENADRRKQRRRVRAYRIAGVLAGLFTMAAVMAAGYLAVNFWVSSGSGTEPTLPAQVSAVSQTVILSTAEERTADESLKETVGTEESEEEVFSSQEVHTKESYPEKTTEENETDREETTEESSAEQLSEDEKRDLELRRKALEKYDNLGIVVGVNNYLNMRTGPSMKDEICGKIFRYCGVNVLEDAGNGWYKIESGGVTGYVAQQFVATGEKAESLALEHCRYQAKILRETLDVLKSPKEGSDVITTVKNGDHYDVLSFKGDWAEIEAVEDLSGYVKVEDISAEYRLEEAIVFGYDDSVSQTRIDIINKAFEYYGNTYVFGGHDLENGIDCSSFTYLIYEMYGIDLVETYSITQSTLGKQVSEQDIRPGDLIFYVGRYPGQIGHVAIYIGNEKIIHAASESKGVCVSDWKYVPIVTIRDVIGDR